MPSVIRGPSEKGAISASLCPVTRLDTLRTALVARKACFSEFYFVQSCSVLSLRVQFHRHRGGPLLPSLCLRSPSVQLWGALCLASLLGPLAPGLWEVGSAPGVGPATKGAVPKRSRMACRNKGMAFERALPHSVIPERAASAITLVLSLPFGGVHSVRAWGCLGLRAWSGVACPPSWPAGDPLTTVPSQLMSSAPSSMGALSQSHFDNTMTVA